MKGSNKIYNNRNSVLDIAEEIKKVRDEKNEMFMREFLLNFVSTINTPKINRLWINNKNAISTIVIEKIDHIKLIGSIFLNKYHQKYAQENIVRNTNVVRSIRNEEEKILREKLEIDTKEILLTLIHALKSNDFESLHISKRGEMIGFYSKDIDKNFLELIIKTLEEYYVSTYSSGTRIRKHIGQ